MDDFWRGANLPWVHYGHDFGAAWDPDGVAVEPERVRADLTALADAGADVVRWFFFADGRAVNAEVGLTSEAVADLDAAFALLDEAGLDVIPVLFDYLVCDSARLVDGVQVGGRSDEVRSPGPLVERVVAPLVERFGEHPRLRAWEVINEPEWALEGARSLVGEPVSIAEMQGFVDVVAAAIRAGSSRPVTVGAASVDDMMGLWAGAGLELLSFHHYAGGPLVVSPTSLGVEVPVLVGELPSVGDPGRDVADAEAVGFVGALPWSLNGEDEATDRGAALAAVGASRGR